MKVLRYFMLVIVLHGCKTQYITQDDLVSGFEAFDIEEYNRRKLLGEKSFFENNCYIKLYGGEVYTASINPNHKFFNIYKEFFYDNGNIKEKGLLFGHVKIGVWEYYNEKGELIRTENEDEKFSKTFNYNDIIDFLHERGKINKYHRNATHELSTSFRKLDGVWKWGVGVYYNKTKKKIITYQGHRYQFDINGKLLSMEENVKIISGGTVH